uniref:Myosin_tail_1 domain-containing protein n=1 Tax=Panagrellus redivivus TaxID=6233 RepID=A0A7E4VWC8_PANRE
MDHSYSSSASSSRHHKHHKSSRHSREHRHSRRSRSRSRSRSPKRYSSSYGQHEKPRREYEIEIEALQEENRDLRMQIEQLHVMTTQSNVARVQAESQAAHWEHETGRINASYQECSKVLRALRQGVDEIESDKQRYMDEAMKAKKERDIADATSDNFRQQMEVVSERNTALVKKCEGYVEENKNLKEKIAKAEEEFKTLRPALAKLEADRDSLKELNRATMDEVALLREKTKAWQAEKKELERQLLRKEALAAVERKTANSPGSGVVLAGEMEIYLLDRRSHYRSNFDHKGSEIETVLLNSHIRPV